ncbi:hypothetical protein N7495_008663 [Penicillium taxi]|uniref:uncharacterized protein n=1 Tax=Penicillium taxi TaxID=168475 RepID=UPI002544F7D8|nr:uncharacterized protein N7495_008663 [Penicillium taxi]KAJ5888622.1 hypothetical protein N7495_008663 [Penicillium taxi]
MVPRKQSPKGSRKLIRWSLDIDTQLLLAIHYACNQMGMKLPWVEIAAIMGAMGEDLFTEGSITQHLAKLYKIRESKGLPVPPPIRRSRKRSGQPKIHDANQIIPGNDYDSADSEMNDSDHAHKKRKVALKERKVVKRTKRPNRHGNQRQLQGRRASKYNVDENADGTADEVTSEDDSRFDGSEDESVYEEEVSNEEPEAEESKPKPSKIIVLRYRSAYAAKTSCSTSFDQGTSVADAGYRSVDPEYCSVDARNLPLNVRNEVSNEPHPFIDGLNPFANGNNSWSADEVGGNPNVAESQGFIAFFERPISAPTPVIFAPEASTVAGMWVPDNVDPRLFQPEYNGFSPARGDLTISPGDLVLKSDIPEGGTVENGANEQHRSSLPDLPESNVLESNIFDEALYRYEIQYPDPPEWIWPCEKR